jgi:hypothetical protein
MKAKKSIRQKLVETVNQPAQRALQANWAGLRDQTNAIATLGGTGLMLAVFVMHQQITATIDLAAIVQSAREDKRDLKPCVAMFWNLAARL